MANRITDAEWMSCVDHLMVNGFDPKEISGWRKKYNVLRGNAKDRGCLFNMTFFEYMTLVKYTGLKTLHDFKNSRMEMARNGDTGGYTFNNCRYVTKAINLKEQHENGGVHRGQIKRNAKMHDIIEKSQNTRSGRQYDQTAAKLKNSKRYRLISPSGEIHIGLNLNEFCKQNGLAQGVMAGLCRGERPGKTHKGWTGEYIDG